MADTAPVPCPWCDSTEMDPQTMHDGTPDAFVRWFCACGSSWPDGTLRQMAATAAGKVTW